MPPTTKLGIPAWCGTPRGFRARRRTLVSVLLLAMGACVGSASSGGVLVQDSNAGCEGGGPVLEYRWERRGAWFVRGDARVPSGVVARLRELAEHAPALDTAPLPGQVRFSEETVMERSGQIYDAACRGRPWLLDWTLPDIDADVVAQAAKEHLVDPCMDTDWSLLHITLPGSPLITIATESQRPYAQPWQVTVGTGEPRLVLSIEISRYAMLFVDPAGPNYRHLEGAHYWAIGFWQDSDLWSWVLGDRWNREYARERCTELEGWDEVAASWELIDADLGDINRQPLSLQPDLVAKGRMLIDFVRWWSRFEDGEPQDDWSVFLDVHARATAAAERLPFLHAWKQGGERRSISLDAVGDVGHNETQPGFFHETVWAHSKLRGDPAFELLLRIDGERVATLLLAAEPDGAIVLDGDASLPGTADVYFHPTVGRYAVIRPDGTVEDRTMPPTKPR